MLLTIFFSFLALTIVLVVVAASSLYLERKRLFTLADGAALAAAEAWSLDEVEVGDESLEIALDDAAVRDAAAAYLDDAAGRLTGVELVRATSRDGRSATVTLRAVWTAPLHTEVLPLSVPIEVTTTARSVFH
ncbi:Putative Flp pilus-assembly TadE/G-like [Agromyces sp. CF514]|uniref:pilus assembly protein TadG-related protein n=1 Tax=Agromyces sp. CF514 TaxID=1881031 RepID=UPI0008EB49B6|nr:pilus assembly protein TadG-related protein [Agromyces sp. CF514]SFR74856.1 Putative Flp pilus-assembly TadE/G-like [Agromyces sp. CF514]